jgi:hypothetical protein
VFANPPFEKLAAKDRAAGSLVNKAAEIFRRTVENLAPNSLFGFVLPQGFLTSKEGEACRRYIQTYCEIHEITLFADKVFQYGDSESAIIIGQKRNAGSNWCVRYQRVRENQVGIFKHTLAPSTSESVKQNELCNDKNGTFLVPELGEVWEYLKEYPRLQSAALVGQGLSHKASPKDNPKRYESQSPKPGLNSAYTFWSTEQLTHLQPVEVFISLKKKDILAERSGMAADIPQVLLNYARVSRESWRLKALLDDIGHPVSSNFLVIRPILTALSLNVIWGILNSPIGNAYSYSYSSKRHVQAGQMRVMPIPDLSRVNLRSLESAVENYLIAARAWSKFRVTTKKAKEFSLPLFEESSASSESASGSSKEALMYLHWRVDAEVLKLYGLPPELERRVLDLFLDVKRRGVPFDQICYFPAHFKDLNTLEELLSITADWDKNSDRKLELIEKKIQNKASTSERAELARLKFLTEARGEYYAPLPLPQLRKMRNDMIKLGTWIES